MKAFIRRPIFLMLLHEVPIGKSGVLVDVGMCGWNGLIGQTFTKIDSNNIMWDHNGETWEHMTPSECTAKVKG